MNYLPLVGLAVVDPVAKFMVSPTQKWAWSGSRDRFGGEPTLFKFANESTMASATPGVKNSPRNGCGVGHLTTV